jgi:D-glycero-D-manno-heptose 1,7-bisphosphate phosphatase
LLYPTLKSLSAVFLDRDGVIVQNRPDYILAWDDVEFIPRSLSALRRLSARRVKVFIVTNQSAIGRGLVDRKTIDEINTGIIREITVNGGRIAGVYICPHSPAEKCDCRKPEPGLIIRAANEHNIDLGDSILIGDAVTDLRAGFAAGIRKLALVRTGRGVQQETAFNMLEFDAEIYDDLHSAIHSML